MRKVAVMEFTAVLMIGHGLVLANVALREALIPVEASMNWVGGSGIKKKGLATTHPAMFDSAQVRDFLRFYDAINRVEDRAVAVLVISSLWVKAEPSRRRQRFCSYPKTDCQFEKMVFLRSLNISVVS